MSSGLNIGLPGRPAIADLNDPLVVKTICDAISSGMGIKKISQQEGMPSDSTIYLKMANDEGFRALITRAREAQQESIVDSTVDMADDATPEDWQVVKLRIWARQWRAAKLAPKKYGEKLQTEVSGPNGGAIPVQHQIAKLNIEDLTAAQRKALRAALEAADDAEMKTIEG